MRFIRSNQILKTTHTSTRTTTLVTALGLFVIAGLASCTVGPNYEAKKVDITDTFGSLDEGVASAPSAEAAARSTTVNATPLAPGAIATWWEQLNDPALTQLVSQAAAMNLDLKLAQSRLREARALRGIAFSARLPFVDARSEATRSRGSENLDNFGNFGGNNSDTTNFQGGLDASWEIDLFGRISRDIEAADADIDVAREAKFAVLVSVVAEVADAYIDHRVLSRRVLVSEQTIAAQRETVNLTQTRLNAGIANELEVAQAQALLSSRQAQLPTFQAGQRLAAHRLAVLLGRAPGTPVEELTQASTLDQIPASMTQVPIGLPSELLRRRPDLRQAERQVAAATARIGVATAELYPRFSLTGTFGFSAGDIANIADGNSRVWSVGPSMRWSIFSAGRIRSQIAAADARAEQSLIQYERSVLVALREVEDSLTNLAYEQDRQSALARTVIASKRAATLAQDRYQSGVGDFLDVLEAQRQAYDAEDQLVSSKGTSLRALIALYKALGGGWPEEMPTPTTPDQTPADEAATAQATLPVQ